MLASVVTFYAINVTTTKTSEESLQIYKQHMWNNGTTYSEAAFLVINTGGRDLVIDKITVRGQETAITSMYFNKTTNTISGDLTYQTPDASGTSLSNTTITIGNTGYTFTLGANGSNLILPAGKTMMVYILNPDHVSVDDIGVTVGFTIFTSNAQWYKECNVEAAS